jgi:hypothetical protein
MPELGCCATEGRERVREREKIEKRITTKFEGK